MDDADSLRFDKRTPAIAGLPYRNTRESGEKDEFDSIWFDELTPAIAGFTLGLMCLLAGLSTRAAPILHYTPGFREYLSGVLLLFAAFTGFRVTGFRRVPAFLAIGSVLFFALGYLEANDPARVPPWSLLLVLGVVGLGLGSVFLWRVLAADRAEMDRSPTPQI